VKRETIKWAAIVGAFAPLVASAVDLHHERALVELRSVQMEDEISAVVEELHGQIGLLEERVSELESGQEKVSKKIRRLKKPRQYNRAWVQQSVPEE
jgi:hypothetical protein